MVQSGLDDQTTLRLEHLLDLLVRIFDVLPSKVGNLLGKSSRIINGTWRHLIRTHDPVGDRNAMIVLTKCGCLVYDTRSRIGGDICVNYDAKRLILKLNRIKKINFKKYIRVREEISSKNIPSQ